MRNQFARMLRYEVSVCAALAAVAALLMTIVPPARASANCPNEQFRTGLGANLPDCRAYEQVSPQEKNGGGVDGGLSLETQPAPDQAALNGESIVYGSQTAFSGADPLSGLATSQYLSRRTPKGWVTEGITPRQELEDGKINLSPGSVEYSLFQGFGPSLEQGYLMANNPAPVEAAPPGYDMPYLRDNFTGQFTLLSDVTPPVALPKPPTCCDKGFGTIYAGMSSDGSHVIFLANDALTPEAIPGHDNLYEWSNGQLELVNVLPNGAVVEGPTRPESKDYGFGGPSELSRQGAFFNFDNAISQSGDRAFWGSEGQVYMHEITASGPRTVEISASQKTNGPAYESTGAGSPQHAHYWAANASGTLVYFTSAKELTNEATNSFVPWENNDLLPEPGDLYQYNAETEKLTDLTVDPNEGEAASVQGVLGISEDGSYVYFAADGVLAEGAKAFEPSRNYNGTNIYVWHDGEIRLIKTLTDGYGGQQLAWTSWIGGRVSRVSPNGEYLAFASASELTGQNTEPATPNACSPEDLDENGIKYNLERMNEGGARCTQVYVYDYKAATLTCASCQPNGLPATGNSLVPYSLNLLPPIGWHTSTEQQRYLFNSGRLFFDSAATLTPNDINGHTNVYEWEPQGVGGCTGTKPCVSLISGGTGTKDSQFVDADAEGNNVFITSFERLAPSDGDENEDLYDVRVDGGLNAQAAPPCQGEACRPAISSAPSIYGAPTSETFDGVGNPFDEPFAAKGGAHGKPSKSKGRANHRERRARALRRCRHFKHAKQRRRCKRKVRRRFAKSARSAHSAARQRHAAGHRTSGNRRGK